MMNCLQRAWRSVIRKPVKSILLLLIIFIISLFLLSGIASKKANIITQDKTRQAIGTGLRLEANEKNRNKRIQEASKKIGESDEGSFDGFHQKKIESSHGIQWQSWTDNSFDTLNIEDIKKIASVSGITNYNITTVNTVVNPVNFKRIEDSDVDQTYDPKGVSLIGNLDMSMDSNVIAGNITVKEGRLVTNKDTNVCIISEELAEQEGLKLGDKLQFNDYRDIKNSTVYEAEIIGIYQTKQKMTPLMSGDTYRSENIIFTDLRFPEKAEGNENDPLFQYSYFKVGDVDKYESVKESVKKVSLNWERYDLIDNNGNMETMSSNFSDMEKTNTLIIVVIICASFAILFLVFVFWIKNRTQEVGILLSLGTAKIGILTQILLEALIIAAIAFSLSILASGAVSKSTTNYLVELQVQQMENKKDSDIGKLGSDYIEPDQTVTGIEVDVTAKMIVADGIGITLLVVVSVLTSGIIILRKRPKDILSEMS